MKLIPTGLSDEQVPFRLPGVTIRKTKAGWVGLKSPAYNPANRSELQDQYVQRFAFAARMASNPMAQEYETAREMSKGTEQVPRDILTMAAMGRYYVITRPNGSMWRHVSRPVLSDPLAVRQAALFLTRPVLPWEGKYLSIGGDYRLILG